jgi:hypothetical protein
MRPRDTSPEAWEIYLDIQRRMPPEKKLESALALSRTVQAIAEAGLKERFPAADEREIFLRRVQLQLGEELFRKAYGVEFPLE